MCGGLGPTHDDITRDAIAEVMDVPLVRDADIVERIAEMFSSRGRDMPESNGRQADVPVGATPIPQQLGTAPGLICPVGHKVVYALPGVPYELVEMFTRAVLPDLRGRADLAGEAAVIMSRVVRTWGMSESGLAELLAPRIEASDAATGQPHHRLPGERDRGDQGAHHGQGARRGGGRRPSRRRGGARCGRSWARSSSGSTTPPWRRRWPSCW